MSSVGSYDFDGVDTEAVPDGSTEPMGRREALKAGAGAALLVGGTLTGTSADAQKKPAGNGAKAPPPRAPSPATRPFIDLMPLMPQLPERSPDDTAFGGFDPRGDSAPIPTVGGKVPNRQINPASGLPYEGRGDAHQLRELAPPTHFYAMRYGAVPAVKIHTDLPPQVNFWGANLGGADLATDVPVTPLPTIVTRYSDHRNGADNQAVVVRRYNSLPATAPSGGFGKNSISAHLHNFHTAPDSDGGPCDPSLGDLSNDPQRQGRFFFPSQYYDHYYSMKRAGFIDPASYSTNAGVKTTPANVSQLARLHPTQPNGDVRETLTTLWYHDHREGATGANVYKGLAGFHLIFNEYDTGNENTGFRLPSFPAYDIPILVTDIYVNPTTNQTEIDLVNINGHLGDKYLVNGVIQPHFPVSRRRYRLRLLNKGPSRHQQLFLTNPANPSQNISFWQITTDGNLLTKPLQVTSVKLAPAQRADVIVDFSQFPAGTDSIWLENRAQQVDPEKPLTTLDAPATQTNALVEFRIGAAVVDNSVNPANIASFAPISLPPVPTAAITRTFNWDSLAGGWAVNGSLVDCTKVRFWMKRGRTERWIFNIGGGWGHPLHMHFVEGRITVRNKASIPSSSPEFSRVDVVALYPGDSAEFVITPVDYVGVYPYHCHNVIHEDYGMMLLFGVDDVGDSIATP